MGRGPMSQAQKDKIRETMITRKIKPSALTRAAAALARTKQGNSPDHRKKIGLGNLGIKRTAEQIEKNRDAQLKWNKERRERGEEHPNVEPRRGKPLSEEAKRKVSLAKKASIADGSFVPFSQLGIKRSDKFKERLSEAHMGVLNPNWKPADVYSTKTGELIASNICIAEFCRDIGYSNEDRTMCYLNANGHISSTGGLIFEYRDKDENEGCT